MPFEAETFLWLKEDSAGNRFVKKPKTHISELFMQENFYILYSFYGGSVPPFI